MTTVTDEQLRILQHMLGIDNRRKKPVPYRDYYCANPGDAALHELMRLGYVRIYAERDGYEWFCTTEQGKSAAVRSAASRFMTKSQRVYSRFLDVKDAFPDLTFKAFLTDLQFAQIREMA